MKTSVFILIVCVLISLPTLAQTKPESKSDSAKIGYNSLQSAIGDTLKLNKPPIENYLQSPYQENKQSSSNLNLALIPRNGQGFTQYNSEMPIYNPGYQSKMPVLKPESIVEYKLLIKKFPR